MFTGTGFSLFTLTLWTKHLVRLYEFLFSMLLIVVSYHCNSQMYNSSTPTNASILNMVVELNLDGLFQVIPYLFYALCNMATQSILASGYLFITLGPPVASIQGLLALSFVVPSFAVMLPFQNDSIPFWGIILPSLHVVGVAIYHLPKVTTVPTISMGPSSVSSKAAWYVWFHKTSRKNSKKRDPNCDLCCSSCIFKGKSYFIRKLEAGTTKPVNESYWCITKDPNVGLVSPNYFLIF